MKYFQKNKIINIVLVQKKKKIGNNISDIVFVFIHSFIIKWKTIENNAKKEKRIEIVDYVLYGMVVTRDTAHFEISPLNADNSNTVLNNNTKWKRETKQIPKKEGNWRTILAI